MIIHPEAYYKRSLFFMAGVVGEAQEQAVSSGVQGAVCSHSFSELKLLLHVLSVGPFVVLSHRGGGHTNHVFFQGSPRTCLVVAVTGQRG